MTLGWQRWLAAGQLLCSIYVVLDGLLLHSLDFRLIIERFANISDGTVVGVRAPFLRVSVLHITIMWLITSDDHWDLGWGQRAVQHDGRPVLCLRLLHHGPSQQGPHLALHPAIQVHCPYLKKVKVKYVLKKVKDFLKKVKDFLSSECLTSATATLATVQAEATRSGKCRSTSSIDVTIPISMRTSPVAISCHLAATSTTRTSSGMLFEDYLNEI